MSLVRIRQRPAIRVSLLAVTKQVTVRVVRDIERGLNSFEFITAYQVPLSHRAPHSYNPPLYSA